MTLTLTQGDCLNLMKTIPDKTIDLLICDLPYGETNCKWDCCIDLGEFWKQFKRIRKHDRVACIHFCSTRFGYTLIKSWEKGYKMDMVWKKRNKTGGLQSRYRPMRNHEMVYFFYDKTPKYNRDKYHKRLEPKKKKGTPVAVAEPKKGKDKNKDEYNSGAKGMVEISKYKGEHQKFANYKPPNPSSVLEEEDTDIYGETKQNRKKRRETDASFEPKNPASVLEEENSVDVYGEPNDSQRKKNKKFEHAFEPPNPASVINSNRKSVDHDKGNDVYNAGKFNTKSFKEKFGHNPQCYEPHNPVSILEEDPCSLYESTKIFIGKRNHQTEKPQDILEFFLKYWSDEGDTILDPTMGSGSTGVACKTLKRNFIGFELNDKIFKKAQERCL